MLNRKFSNFNSRTNHSRDVSKYFEKVKNSDQTINHLALKLNGKIYGLAPVQAEGTIDTNQFYFRAKYDEWSFAISENPEFDPVDIQNIENGIKYGFYKESEYGKKGSYSASYMDRAETEKIIIECCKEYQEMKKANKRN